MENQAESEGRLESAFLRLRCGCVAAALRLRCGCVAAASTSQVSSAIKRHLAPKNKTKGALHYANALDALKRRNLPLPETLLVDGCTHALPSEAIKLLRGLATDHAVLQGLLKEPALRAFLGEAALEPLGAALAEETSTRAEQLAVFKDFVELYQKNNNNDVKINIAVSKHHDSVILAEAYAVLRGIGYSAQEARDAFNDDFCRRIKGTRRNVISVASGTLSGADFLAAHPDGRLLIIGHVKAPGAKASTPYLSSAAMESLLEKAAPSTQRRSRGRGSSASLSGSSSEPEQGT